MRNKSSKKINHPELQLEEHLSVNALAYHQYPISGKLEINATKDLNNQRDLSFAYSPGVGFPCMAIHEDPDKASIYTIRSNLVAVISNGSAVLGLGNIGPLASKPVMEGKAVLFKKFAGINVFDIEIDAKDIETMVSTISSLEPTFGGINLEDIKSPECFEVERILSEKMDIPVFHDDQHGTAITVAAAILNGMELAKKSFSDIKIVTLGAGAAALACLNLLVKMGVKRENIWIHDLEGLVYKGRKKKVDKWKSAYAQDSGSKTLAETMENADVFLGLSVANALDPVVLKNMAKNPLIMPLANPIPEVMPDVVKKIRPDAMVCTGRSDFPNQVNNVLCFPYIFRGALDCGASDINEEMKIAVVRAMAKLARDVPHDVVIQNFSDKHPVFGPDYLIPSPFDPNLILHIAPAVAIAAEKTGVAKYPIKDYDAYRDSLKRFAFPISSLMNPVFEVAKKTACKRVLFCQGESERVLRAAQTLAKANIARPVLIGDPLKIQSAILSYALKIVAGKDFDIIDPHSEDSFQEFVDLYRSLNAAKGISMDFDHNIIRSNNILMGSLALRLVKADAMISICEIDSQYESHLEYIDNIIGKRNDISNYSAMSILFTKNKTLFFADTHISLDPSAKEIAESIKMAAKALNPLGIVPRISLLSHLNCSSHDTDSYLKMCESLKIIRDMSTDLVIDSEVQQDIDLSNMMSDDVMPNQAISNNANLLIFPNIDSANIALAIAKSIANGTFIGPVLLGAKLPAHILPSSVSAEGIVNMAALAVASNFENCQ
ncbi:phosphate acyltransferase [Candidatus Liberibacter americanus]|uniref:Malic enzyme n=1 Tax=Candidatus Liberibacter americanus str. Sao Paulo TaxID=1261131 RepID=U6B7I5_9HYPH|nr:phosphate acyltransferase [Candidatus Liberibacter americanus]AHA27826.1 Malic enzyme [Candidatus Liberibacter americanus str. Sao Paulo]EMS35993.1 malic enzyme [Candidatus Liberibacter americanus PW_SP]